MPRPKTTGLKSVRKRRPDGSAVAYFYDRATGRFLSNDRDTALAMLAPSASGLQEIDAGAKTLATLVGLYYRTNEFENLAPRTRELYRHNLTQVLDLWGKVDVRVFKRGHFEKMKIDLKDTPYKCNNILRVLRIVFTLAHKRLEWIDSNPLENPGLIELAPRAEIWDVETEAKFLAAAPPRVKFAYLLMLYTGQSFSDVLAMTLSQVTEHNGRLFIHLRQTKTDVLLALPVHENLEPVLRRRLAETIPSTMLVASPRGLFWTRRNFSKAWDQIAKKVGASGEVQRRDIRRTAVVRMAECGLPTPLIASVTGHKIDACQKIIDTYLPRRPEVALAAIEAWERAPAPRASTVVQLAARGAKR